MTDSNTPQQSTPDMILGIDLGTTNSLIAIYQDSRPRVLTPTEDLSPIVPSVVRYEQDGSVVVGQTAKDQQPAFPTTTISSVKRLLGRSLKDAAADLPYLGYHVLRGDRDTTRISIPVGDQPLIVSPEEVSAEILKELKRRAEQALGRPVSKAVVTVPAYFDDAQRQATRDAGRIAGLEVVRIVNEPTAAALAYGLGLPNSTEPRHVAVFDLGGGTFDISILRITPPQSDQPDATGFFQVLATAGDTHLGGDDVDHLLINLFTTEIRAQLDLPDSEDSLDAFPPETRRALAAFAQSVKHTLSANPSATVQIDTGHPEPYHRTITRNEFDTLITPWVKRSIEACKKALRDARRELEGAELDAIVMVGGSTRIPLVRARVAQFFEAEPYTALDPDRVVALGAAVQAGLLSGAATGSLLLDVIPLSLGIETAGGAASKLIVRNSGVPTRATEMFSTQTDGQTSIKINVLQGEREMAEDCRSLGVFHLQGLPPMPAGIPQLEVQFAVDANGVLTVNAHERRSGKRLDVQIIPNHGLTQTEVQQIEHDSLEHARDDMTRHRVVDLIVNSKLDLKWINERLTKHEHALDPGLAATLRSHIERLESMVRDADQDWRSVDANSFYAAKQQLDEASVRLQEVSIAASLRDESTPTNNG